MTHQQQPTIQWSRDFLKCDQCRKEHKKCLPRGRDWDGQQQKCDRCYRLGNPCGPPMRKQKSVSADRNGFTETTRCFRRQSPRQDIPSTNIADSPVRQSRSIETRSNHEEPACLVRVAVMIATHELLLSQLFFLKRRNSTSASEQIRMEEVSKNIDTAIKQVRSAFKRATRSVQAKIARLRGLEGQLLGWKMAYFDEWHHGLTNIKSLSEIQAYISTRDRRAACMPFDADESRILLCTSAVFQDAQTETRTRSEQSNLDQEDYLGLEVHIKNLFLDIQDFDADGVSPTLNARLERSNTQEPDSFPASHVAYLNQDREIALQLWKRLPNHPSGIDIVRRSFIHIVAASQDLETMAKITKHAPEAVKHAHRDQLGLYPMDLVSGPDSRAIRVLLSGVGAKSIAETRRVLARLAETQDCPSFASRLRNNQYSTDTPMEAAQDLDDMRFPEVQMVDSTSAFDDSMNFMPYPTMDPNFMYGNYVMHGPGNMLQPSQHFNNQVQLGLQNSTFTTPGSQFSHNYNSYYHTG